GNSTAQADMDYLKAQAKYDVANGINDGTVQYTGVATYADNLHLAANGNPMNLVLNGTSAFDVDFVNDSLTGDLTFTDKNIAITANINGNTFAGTNAANNVATAGGFYGEDANFLGGIYQEALNSEGSDVPGTGTDPGTGTTFQGTFGATKQ
ncbi:transferrin-binding protein-like solute binding protein, partial [Psychrobacter sp. 1Y11]|uniref:transferrin-binding protein-like solute binding protein n=1 Tax=Psychrobacter sp. 1Y11 TaxID=3457446 RepID=UPI003FD495C3